MDKPETERELIEQLNEGTPFFKDGPTFVPQIWEYGIFQPGKVILIL